MSMEALKRLWSNPPPPPNGVEHGAPSPVIVEAEETPQAPPARSRGDVVRLKSGGPLMTVTGVTERKAIPGASCTCFWFDGAALRYGEFPEEAVEAAEKPAEVKF